MAHRAGKKEETRGRVLAAAGRGFRRHGYGGIGVDGLAKEAGVTSGAFYANYRSKTDAFRDVVSAGMKELRAGVEQFRQELGARWRSGFVDFYLGDRRTCDLSTSCALQSLTGEVARADEETQGVYEDELRGVINSMTAGLDGHTALVRREDAIALLALLSGGVSIARAVNDPAFGEEIARAVKQAADRLSIQQRLKANPKSVDRGKRGKRET